MSIFNVISVLSISRGFHGLSLEDLLPYQNDPFWMNVRRATMILFWAAMLLMIFITCMITAVESERGCAGMMPQTVLTSMLTSAVPILDTRSATLSV